MGNKQLVIGMFGFGNVGRGLYDVLNTISSNEAVIKRVCVRDITKEIIDGVDFMVNPRFQGRPTGQPSSIIAFGERNEVKIIRE